MEEQVQVEKTPVVREEVSLKKQQVQGTRQVSDTVKREEAWVDTMGEADVRTASSRQWQGKERRRKDSSYAGQDRRMASR
jgi:stress response protein YsnF